MMIFIPPDIPLRFFTHWNDVTNGVLKMVREYDTETSCGKKKSTIQEVQDVIIKTAKNIISDENMAIKMLVSGLRIAGLAAPDTAVDMFMEIGQLCSVPYRGNMFQVLTRLF